MNGDSVLAREVSDDIRKLDNPPSSLKCDWGLNVMRPAVIRALRLAETAMRSQRLVLVVLLVILSNTKVKGFSLTEFLMSLAGL